MYYIYIYANVSSEKCFSKELSAAVIPPLLAQLGNMLMRVLPAQAAVRGAARIQYNLDALVVLAPRGERQIGNGVQRH